MLLPVSGVHWLVDVVPLLDQIRTTPLLVQKPSSFQSVLQ
jgi:hypothetical protein